MQARDHRFCCCLWYRRACSASTATFHTALGCVRHLATLAPIHLLVVGHKPRARSPDRPNHQARLTSGDRDEDVGPALDPSSDCSRAALCFSFSRDRLRDRTCSSR